jgi:hypothetical protein
MMSFLIAQDPFTQVRGYHSAQVIHNIHMVHIRPAHLTRLNNISEVAEILSR